MQVVLNSKSYFQKVFINKSTFPYEKGVKPELQCLSAKEARMNWHRPIGEWSKKTILKVVSELCDIGFLEPEFDISLLQLLSLSALRKLCLRPAGFYQTQGHDHVWYYAIDEELLAYLTQEDVCEIVF